MFAGALHGLPVKGGRISIENCNRATRDDKLARNDLMKDSGTTLDPISEPDVRVAWSAKIELDAGTVELIPWTSSRQSDVEDATVSLLSGPQHWPN